MIFEVRYKGQKINPNDIELVYSDHWGIRFIGSIEDYGITMADDARSECEAGEGW